METESRFLHHGYQGESFNPIGPSFFTTFTCGGITNRIDHVSDEGTAGWTVLCELIRDSRPVLSPPVVAEDSRSGEGFRVVCLDRGCSRLQVACKRQKEVPDQLTTGTFCSMALKELRQYITKTASIISSATRACFSLALVWPI